MSDPRFLPDENHESAVNRWSMEVPRPAPRRPSPPPAADDALELREILAVVRRHLLVMIAAVVAAVGGMGYLVYQEVPEYRASAVVRVIDQRGAVAGGIEATMASQMVSGWVDPVLSQIVVLEGREVVGRVVDQEHLRLSPSDPALKLSSFENVHIPLPAEEWDSLHFRLKEDAFVVSTADTTAIAEYGEPVRLRQVRFALTEPPPIDEAVVFVAPREDVIDWVSESLQATAREGTDGIDVSFTWPDSVLAERVVNAVVETFRDENTRAAQRQARRRREFLEEQLATTDSVLVAAQVALSGFKSREEVASSAELLAAQQQSLMELDVRTQELAAERRMYRDLLDQLDRPRRANQSVIETLVSSPGIAENPVVASLYEQLIEYETAIDTMTTGTWARSLTNPDVERLISLRETTESRLVDALQSHMTALEARLQALSRLREASSADIRALPSREAEEFRLQQQVATVSQIGDQLRQDYQKARIAEAVEIGQVEIVQLAGRSLPVGSNKPMKMALALMLGLMLGGGASFVIEHMNTSIRRREDVEAALNLPELAFIPQIQSARGPRWKKVIGVSDSKRVQPPRPNGTGKPDEKAVVTVGKQTSAPAEAYRTLRTNLIFSQAARTYRTVLVTSPGASEGKTTTAANLAVTFAQQGIKVLLMDCDLRKPTAASLFGLSRRPGLVDVLMRHTSWQDAVRPTNVDQLDVLPSGTAPPNPSEVLGGAEMKKLLAWVTTQYDVIILDSPPVLAAPDASVLSSSVDGVLIVLRAGSTDRVSAQRAQQQLDTVGARVIGAVLNDPDKKSQEPYGAYYYTYREVAAAG